MTEESAKQTKNFDVLLGQRLRELRKKRGYSQARLAEILGITFQQIQKYEIGKNRLSATRLMEICAILKTDIYFFILQGDEYQKYADQKFLALHSLWDQIPYRTQQHFMLLMEDFIGSRG